MIEPLDPAAVYRPCSIDQFTFQTTAELPELTEIIGQARAVEAVRFGIGIRHEGYNLFVLGPPGTGKFSLVRQFLEQEATTKPVPPDWCYVYNFAHPRHPRALRLPHGQGVALRQDMARLVEDLRTTIPAVFESEDYRARKQAIAEAFKTREGKLFEELQQQAEAVGIALIRTQAGLGFAPVREGQVLSPEQFQELPPAEQEQVSAHIAELQEQLQTILQEAPQWERELRDQIKSLDRELVLLAITPLMDKLHHQYSALTQIVDYLQAVQQDVLDNLESFQSTEEDPQTASMAIPLPRTQASTLRFRRYQVNVLVEHGDQSGAPVIYEDYPTYQNLVGQVEQLVTQMGALLIDFLLIKPGALHRANGGYLVLEVHKLLSQPMAWEQLKRSLRAGEIRIESPGQTAGLVSTVSLEPEPIPLEIKIVLVGDRSLYYLLAQSDPDFNELFKVEVDFEEQMRRTPENDLLYARLIGTLAAKEGLRPFDRTGVARIIEHSARLAGDAERLSTHMQSVADLSREADYWAGEASHPVISAADVQQAIDAQWRRANRVHEQFLENIQRETILIDTTGEKVGQINGLTVISLGNTAFGHPIRITARVWLGKGEVVDIEREVNLGGPLHSKGVLILSGFLGARYALEHPLSLSASLVFEQSYGGVDGDSASSAELYALLSALAEAPLKQSFAVTGSVNQLGQVQAIGGVNEKIEGFFDICRARGLTGDQGVLIPAANVKHLMLRRDVVEAVAAGQFQIYPVETIDQGIELLTGLPAGDRDEAGHYPEGSINQRVEARLTALAEKWQALKPTLPDT
jgi:lon-related putative ATP-dependent protease